MKGLTWGKVGVNLDPLKIECKATLSSMHILNIEYLRSYLITSIPSCSISLSRKGLICLWILIYNVPLKSYSVCVLMATKVSKNEEKYKYLTKKNKIFGKKFGDLM